MRGIFPREARASSSAQHRQALTGRPHRDPGPHGVAQPGIEHDAASAAARAPDSRPRPSWRAIRRRVAAPPAVDATADCASRARADSRPPSAAGRAPRARRAPASIGSAHAGTRSSRDAADRPRRTRAVRAGPDAQTCATRAAATWSDTPFRRTRSAAPRPVRRQLAYGVECAGPSAHREQRGGASGGLLRSWMKLMTRVSMASAVEAAAPDQASPRRSRTRRRRPAGSNRRQRGMPPRPVR